MKSPSGTKNYQWNDTNQKPKADSHPCKTSINGSLIWEILEAGILYFVRKCCWFVKKRHCIVGWFPCSWGEVGFYNWEDDAGLDRWVVILSYITINKFLWVFFHMNLYLWILLFMNSIVWSMRFWFHIGYDVLDRDALIVCCYFESIGTL